MTGAQPWLLDLYCCQGGASAGYRRAGFRVVGVDLAPQPRYPYEFHRADAIEYLTEHGHRFQAIAGSPPCQRYSVTQGIYDNDHPDLIWPTRLAMIETGKPYVIENVAGARDEMNDPIELCGAMFGLHTYRHRLFETNARVMQPEHPAHIHPVANPRIGGRIRNGDFYIAVGNFDNPAYVRRDLGCGWMSREGLRECIPPSYTEFIGKHLLKEL